MENEISYLAFPEVPEALVIFGEGFAATVLDAIPWLGEKHLVYWGDIDTHGFAILDRLRARFGSVTSILMDHTTLLAHPQQLVREDNPTSVPALRLPSQRQTRSKTCSFRRQREQPEKCCRRRACKCSGTPAKK